ncbi:uncharacterized protein LOC122009331 [Zingiber officinale]|uniref:uncharacterized protein LOC122009331 n=1 Tax=Zingiber officinale TaxID=94328 RepID=UPI001C4B3472|nr:uncharacterized protein LOC122009331 [Zingiber officinale]
MIHQVINEMEKVGDSQPSSSDPVSPTSNEMMKEPPRRLEIVTSDICFEKIKCVLGKLKGELSLLYFGLSLLFFGLPLLSSTTYWAIVGMVMIMDYLLNGRGDAIKSITALVDDEMDDAIKSITELDAIKSIDNDDGDEDEIKPALVLDEDAITPITAHGGYGRICCMTATIPVGRMP